MGQPTKKRYNYKHTLNIPKYMKAKNDRIEGVIVQH